MFVREIFEDPISLNPPIGESKGTVNSVLQRLKELGKYILIVPVMLIDKLITRLRGDESETTQKVTQIADEEFFLVDDIGEKVCDPNRESAGVNLKSDEMLTNNTVLQYLEHLGVEYMDHFISSNPATYEAFLSSLQDKPIERFYIPVVLKGSFRNHIVLITINQDCTIEYYDPKGVLCYMEKKKLLNFPEKTVENLMIDLVSKYPGNPKQNKIKQQKDHHSCGVFVLRYIQQRENEQSFEHIVQDTDNPSNIRRELLSQPGKVSVDKTPICEDNKNDYLKPLDLEDLPNLGVSYCEEFMAPPHKEKFTLSSLLRGVGKVYVPMVLRRFEENHIVLLTFDPKKKTAEYYDPEGSAIGEVQAIVTEQGYNLEQSKFVPGSTVLEVIKMQHGLDI